MALGRYKQIIEKDCLVVSFPFISKKSPCCFWAQKSDTLMKSGSHQYVDEQIFVPCFNNQQMNSFIPFSHKQASPSAHHFVKEQIQQCSNIPTKLKQQMKRSSILIIDDYMNRTTLSTENKTFYQVCNVFFLIQSTDPNAYRPDPVHSMVLKGPIMNLNAYISENVHSMYAFTLNILCSPTLDMQVNNALHHFSVVVNNSVLCVLVGHSWVAFQVLCNDKVPKSHTFEGHAPPELYVLQRNTTILFIPHLNALTFSSLPDQPLYDFENVCKFLDTCKEDVKNRNYNNTNLTQGVKIYKNIFGVYKEDQSNFLKTLLHHSQNTDQYYIYKIKFNVQYLFLQWYNLWNIQNILLPDCKVDGISHIHRLGGVKPHNLNSVLLWEYCRLRIRLTIDFLLRLDTKPNQYYGVVLILTDLENIALKEWNDIQMILEAFTNELKDMTYPKHHIFCVLICMWNPEYRLNILPFIQDFFSNQDCTSMSNDFESLNSKNKKRLMQRLIQEYQLLCNKNFSKSLINLLEASQLTLSKAQRILYCWTLFNSTSLVAKFKSNMKQFPELFEIENTTETTGYKDFLQEDSNQVLTDLFDEKAQKIIKDLDFYIFLPIQKPKLFHSPPMHYDPRALLCGTSGTGKTRILNYLTKKYPHVHVSIEHLTSLYSPYFGETERRLQNEIKQMKLPGVFVLEGLELLSVQDEQGEQDSTQKTFHRRILVTLLLCLDGFHDTVSKRSGQLGFIGVSKVPPEHLDSSLTRPGRLERWFLL